MSNIKDKIIENASVLISEEGLSSFSFTKLASQCCCSKSTLYINFESKENLILGIYIKNIDEIVAFNKQILSNVELTASDKMTLACMYDVVRVAMNYNAGDRVSLIAATPSVYKFVSNDLFFQLEKSLSNLNYTFSLIEDELVSTGVIDKESINRLSKIFRIQARGMVSCISNEVYLNSCIKLSLEELYLGFKSIAVSNFTLNPNISFDDCINTIKSFLLAR
ncbi:TetR/AcrR family transcriptional regulator [Shewanella youngdeokensis]|uniref:TetR/AcrR family transcriptional regulator n=1 Tax=Shewanella youngdeokensis TaxID=2999068 RepID=A0ABZ0K2L0_9GAMM|nr:TetR/AcrR family transcriptional regulator [Shewanella sp. DAU334]